jgi:3-deoxy-D-manno-octulosonic-acid transferase
VVKYVKRSDLKSETRGACENCQVLLLDTMGELATLYALASVVFIGGSLVPTGGHNILEPAVFRKPMIFGPSMSNFREMSEYFLQHEAAVQVKDSAELGNELVRMCCQPELRQQIGDRGHGILMANRGAAQRILNRIESVERSSKYKPRSAKEEVRTDQ